MNSSRPFDLEERLLRFTERLVDVVEALPAKRVSNHVANQLTRCGTAPLANYSEAQSAESRADFVHKLKVALKELREVRVWLLLVQRKGMAGPPEKMEPFLGECNELISILFASVRTAQKNMRHEGTSPTAP